MKEKQFNEAIEFGYKISNPKTKKEITTIGFSRAKNWRRKIGGTISRIQSVKVDERN